MKRGLPSGRSAFLAGKLLVERTVLFRLFPRRAQRVFGFGERLLQLPDLRFQRLDLVLQLGVLFERRLHHARAALELVDDLLVRAVVR